MGNSQDFLKELTGSLGRDMILTDHTSLSLYSGGSIDRITVTPMAVVKPLSTDDVSKTMALAHRYSVPVVVRGGGSSPTGAVVPKRNGIVIDMKRLDSIELDLPNGLVISGSGSSLMDVDSECKRSGFFFPPDPSSVRVATVGGAIAENSGGMRVARYGPMKNWILKIEAVLSDGTITTFGEGVYKNRAGYDFISLITGSEGTLAIVTKAWLKIMPLPAKIRRIAGFFKDLHSAGDAIFRVRREGVNPLILEYADIYGISASNKVRGTDYPETPGGMVLVDVDGDEESTENSVGYVENIFRSYPDTIVIKPQSKEEMEGLMEVRRIAFTSPGLTYSGFIDGDIVVPLSRIRDALEGIEKIRKKYNVYISVAGHAGDGNLHPNIGSDLYNSEEWGRAKKASDEIAVLGVKLGGSVSGEHGIGMLNQEKLLMQFREKDQMMTLKLMKEVKKVFDPKGILNPGKFGLEME